MTLHKPSGSRHTLPNDGDVLVSRVGATGRYSIAILPESPHLTRERRIHALQAGTMLARERSVDVWLTEDWIHFVCLGRHRE